MVNARLDCGPHYSRTVWFYCGRSHYIFYSVSDFVHRLSSTTETAPFDWLRFACTGTFSAHIWLLNHYAEKKEKLNSNLDSKFERIWG